MFPDHEDHIHLAPGDSFQQRLRRGGLGAAEAAGVLRLRRGTRARAAGFRHRIEAISDFREKEPLLDVFLLNLLGVAPNRVEVENRIRLEIDLILEIVSVELLVALQSNLPQSWTLDHSDHVDYPRPRGSLDQ